MTDLKSNPSQWNPEFSASPPYSPSWDTRGGSHLFHLLTKTDLSPLHLGVLRSPVLSWNLPFLHPERPAEGGRKALRRPWSLCRLPASASLAWHHGGHRGKLPCMVWLSLSAVCGLILFLQNPFEVQTSLHTRNEETEAYRD